MITKRGGGKNETESNENKCTLMNDWLSEWAPGDNMHNLGAIAESTAAPSCCEGPTAQLPYDLAACAVSYSQVH